MAENERKAVTITWHPEDIQGLRPEWSLDRCEEWLMANGKHIRDRSVELGHEVIEDLLSYDEAESTGPGVA